MSMEERKISIEDLLGEDEAVFEFSLGYDPRRFSMIGPCRPDGTAATSDVAGCVEDTLHRILDEGGTEEDVRSILGARGKNEEDDDEDLFEIDLGYVLDEPPAMIEATGVRRLGRRSFLEWIKDGFTLDATSLRLIENVILFLDKSDLRPQEKTFALADVLDAGIGIGLEDAAMLLFD